MRSTAVRHDFTALQPCSLSAARHGLLQRAITGSARFLLALAAALPTAAFAQTTYFWNGLDQSASPADGGTGTWDGTTLNWRQGTDAGTAVAWPAAGAGTDEAIFAGTAGTVTLSDTQTANQLDFDVTGYTLTGGTLALDGTAPAISVTTGTATVGSAISGSAGLVKTGDGTLVLSAANTFTGGTTISAGTLQLNAQAAAANGLITLGDAATGTSDVQLTLNTNIDRSGFTSAITVASQGTGTATIKWIETGVTGNPSTGTGQITLGRATIFDATQLAGGAYLFNHPLSGAGDLSLTNTNGVRFLLQAASADYTGNITVQNGGIFEPRNYLSNATGNNVTVDFGGELRIQFDSSSIGGLDGDGIVQSVSRAATLSVGKNNASGSFAGTLQNAPTVLSLTKIGAGTQILSGANTYTGTTTISGGTLQIGDGGTTGSVASGITNNATLAFNRSDAFTVSNVITGTGVVSQVGSGTVSLTGSNTYSGGTSVTSGVLETSAAGVGSTGTITVSGGTLRWASGNTTDYSGRLGLLADSTATLDTNGNDVTLATSFGDSTSGSLTKSGTGSLTLSAANSYSGGTTVSAGTLILNNSTAAGSSLITLGDAETGTSAVQLTLGTNIDRSGFTNDVTVANEGTGTATIKWIETGTTSGSGSGTITLERATTFDGTQFSGGYYLFNHTLSGDGDITLTSTAGTRFLLQVASPGYTGDITVQSGGIFEPRNKLSAATGNSVTVDSGGQLRVQADASSIGGLNGSGSVQPVNFATGSLTIGKGNASGSFSGVISGGLQFTKTGTGTQIFSGTNTYTGTTTISGGTLQIGDGGATGSVASGITNNATLAFNRSDAVTVSNVIGGTGLVSQTGSGTVSLTGSNTYSGGTSITSGVLETSAAGVGSTGTITVSGGTLRWAAGNTTDYSARLGLLAGSTATLDTNGNDVTLATGFGDSTSGGLTKTGAGTLTLSGVPTYSGGTTVSQGTLAVTGSIASSATTVGSGGTLTGTGSIGALTVADGGALTPGDAGIGTLSVDSLTFGSTAGDTATVAIGLLGSGGVPSSLVAVTGNVTANGSAGGVTFAFGNDLSTMPSGTYSLLTYGGTQLADVSAFTTSGSVGARQGVSLGNGTGSIDLVVTNAWPIWTGDNGSGWSTADNWELNTNLNPTSFLASDTVFFSDGAATGTVELSQDVDPTTTTFDSNSLDYTLASSGGFGITSGNLVKSGSATVTISTVNFFTGGTTLSAGTLRAGADNAFGTGPVAVTAAGTTIAAVADADLASSLGLSADVAIDTDVHSMSFAGAVTGSGGFTKSGSGTLTLAGANTYSGNTAINAGTLVTGGNSSSTGTLSGSGDLVKTGSGTLAFSSAGSFTGAATVVAGTMQLGGGASPSAITLGTADTGSDDVQITLGTNTDRTGFIAPITVSNQGTGTATIKWIETGTTGLSGNGTISLNRDTVFDLNELGGGFFQFVHELSGAGNITVTDSTGTRFLLQADSPNYTGDITVQNGGIFEPRQTLSATSGNNLTIDSGGIAYFFGTSTIGGLNGGGNVSRSAAGDGTISVGKGDASGSFSGSITTGVALVKTGTGSQVLSGASTTASAVTIVAGTLQIGSTSGAGSGAITLGTAATGSSDVQLTLGSDADRSGFGNAITVANQGTGTATIKWIETGEATSSGTGTIRLDRATTFDGTQFSGGYFDFNHALTGSGDLTLTNTNGTRFIIDADSLNYTGDITIKSGGILEPREMLSATTGNSITVESGGELRTQQDSSIIGGLNGAGIMRQTTNVPITVTLGKGDAPGNFSGDISGDFLALAKTGSGTQVFSGNNSYAGGTTINAGTLEAANNSALGTGNVTIANGATLRVAAGTTIANTLSLAGSTLELESPEALGTVAGLIAGTSATPASLTPTVAWRPQVAGTTYSDVLDLTNTAGTIQILEVSYDPSTLGSIAPADLFLGWDDNGAWVNAIDGNSGSVGVSAVFNQTGSLTSLGILATADFLGSWGRDTTANTAWAVIDHNSDFAVIAVPEPGTLALVGVAAALGIVSVRRRLRPEVR